MSWNRIVERLVRQHCYISLCGTLDTSITIRTLTACNGNLYCSAGGGIVADSQVDAEYQETFDKVNRILKQLE
mgnify:CR=1 FL=1